MRCASAAPRAWSTRCCPASSASACRCSIRTATSHWAWWRSARPAPDPPPEVSPPQAVPPTPAPAESLPPQPDAPATLPASAEAYALPGPVNLRYEVSVQTHGITLGGQARLDWRHDGEQYEARL